MQHGHCAETGMKYRLQASIGLPIGSSNWERYILMANVLRPICCAVLVSVYPYLDFMIVVTRLFFRPQYACYNSSEDCRIWSTSPHFRRPITLRHQETALWIPHSEPEPHHVMLILISNWSLYTSLTCRLAKMLPWISWVLYNGKSDCCKF
jgi:hypothetical protein